MTTAVAVGGATGWQDELAKLLAVGFEPTYFLACNDAGTELDPLDHWCTLHPPKLLIKNQDHDRNWSWTRQRAEAGLRTEYVTWSHGDEPRTDRTLEGWSDGSSGMFTVGVALHGLGCGLVVCCGIRIDGVPNVYRGEKTWQKHRGHRTGWERQREVMHGRVFSMSGWTRSFLGAPPFLRDAA